MSKPNVSIPEKGGHGDDRPNYVKPREGDPGQVGGCGTVIACVALIALIIAAIV